MDSKKATWKDLEDCFAAEIIEQSKRTAKRWFITWIITFAALIGTNAYWIHTFNSYDYVSQDGSGVNSINTGTQEDTSIVSEDAN